MSGSPFGRRGRPPNRPPSPPYVPALDSRQKFYVDAAPAMPTISPTFSAQPSLDFQVRSVPDSTTSDFLPEPSTISNTVVDIKGDYPRFSSSTTATVATGAYSYTDDLLALAERVAPTVSSLPALEGLASVVSPLIWSEWSKALQDHPDQRLKDYLLCGIRDGFRVGFNPSQPLKSADKNMPSARLNPTPVTNYLQIEQQAGRVLGPFQQSQAPDIHISSFGVIPKKHQPGKWRLILDLSHPPNQSVNDGIAKELASLRYASVDDAARIVTQMGPGTLLAKIDIAHAFRNVPVHPGDRRLLGMQWENQIYIDTALPFGLRSAPKIFSAISDTLEWILFRQGMSSCLHYLDDFLTMGAPNSEECERNLKLMLRVCELLGLPVATHKVEGPTTGLDFLGIEFDTVHMIMRLPTQKLERLKQLLNQWLEKKAARKRAILSLIGELAHASKVIAPGRTFLRRMLDTAHSRPHLDHWIRLSKEFRSDLMWWYTFIEQWNGVSLLASHIFKPPAVTVFTDASGNWGCGATDGKNWLQCEWEESWKNVNIATKELVPIILAVGIWGHSWKNLHVLFRSDNMAVVEILKTKTSRDSNIMHLLRCLHFFCAIHDIRISATHIAGVANIPADALSRNNTNQFFASFPKASPHPTKVPRQLWSLVVADQPDWLSINWRSKLSSFSKQA